MKVDDAIVRFMSRSRYYFDDMIEWRIDKLMLDDKLWMLCNVMCASNSFLHLD